MEIYTLVVLVALFLGVMGIILMMERRRRSDLAQREQLQQSLSACLGSLQAIQSSNEAHMAQVASALAQVQTVIQAGTLKLSDVSQANSKELVERLEWFAKQLMAATQTGTKELQAEAQRTTKAIHDLQASLEESVNFERKI